MIRVIALGCVLFMMGCQRASVGDASFKTIMVRSVGEVEALPNEASFHIALNCLDGSVKASKDCLVTKSNELVDRLEAFGINKKDILTTSVNLDKSYTWRNNSNVFEGYRSTTTIIVTVKNIDKLDEIYTELLENRNLELSGLNYNHSDLDSLENAAYVKALKKSEKLADKLLANLPEDKKEILKIGNIEISSSMPTTDGYLGDAVHTEQAVAVSNRGVRINAGTVKINATLFVEYQIH